MEPYTLDRNFHKRDVIDGFDSVIWTERYFGDSEVELVVPATREMIKKLPEGIFLGLDKSDEIMILETAFIEEDKLKLTGISLLPWMNNRFVRASNKHEDTVWVIPDAPGTVGYSLWAILYYMCCQGSYYLNGTVNTGIANPQQLAIPNLGLRDYDRSGPNISISVDYGPVYDRMRQIAFTYGIGMQITLDSVTDTSYFLGFRSYKGLDRTSSQTENPIVRFSPQMDSLTNIKELRSIAALKTLIYAFAPSLKPEEGDPDLRTTPGVSRLTGEQYVGFDLRAQMIYSDIQGDTTPPLTVAKVLEILNGEAKDELAANPFIKAVDGEIVPTSQFKYGVHYNLGDIIEIQGNSEIVSKGQVLEYIRAQDEAGEKAYPTVTMLD
jgi:sulfur carrier protein ThiS